jgi:hypothetical protein
MDRLPAENERVLVWFPGEDVPQMGTRIGDRFQGSGLFVKVSDAECWTSLAQAKAAPQMAAALSDIEDGSCCQTNHPPECCNCASVRAAAALRSAGLD